MFSKFWFWAIIICGMSVTNVQATEFNQEQITALHEQIMIDLEPPTVYKEIASINAIIELERFAKATESMTFSASELFQAWRSIFESPVINFNSPVLIFENCFIRAVIGQVIKISSGNIGPSRTVEITATSELVYLNGIINFASSIFDIQVANADVEKF